MKVLLIGLGSIAKKHLKALRHWQPEVDVFALRSSASALDIEGVENIYSWDAVPSEIAFILISNPTSEHFKTLKDALLWKVPIFLEKPPFADMKNVDSLLEEVRASNIKIYTAFNLRFHPVISWLKNNIHRHRVIEVNVYCGSFLPEWRPTVDYRSIYSAQKGLGGGVHLDLIHELDYVTWLFGLPTNVQTMKRTVSDLEIDSIDSAKYWLEYDRMTVSIVLNYFRKDARRTIEIVTNETTIEADLIKCHITDKLTNVNLFVSEIDPMNTYKLQMKYFLDGLKSEAQYMNDLNESAQTLNLCLQ